ncbi:hypothetical protein GQR58_016623 [Nymphon striatum]|nr:hypothetical protein GQR58_016623 [Nymphon striatum]
MNDTLRKDEVWSEHFPNENGQYGGILMLTAETMAACSQIYSNLCSPCYHWGPMNQSKQKNLLKQFQLPHMTYGRELGNGNQRDISLTPSDEKMKTIQIHTEKMGRISADVYYQMIRVTVGVLDINKIQTEGKMLNCTLKYISDMPQKRHFQKTFLGREGASSVPPNPRLFNCCPTTYSIRETLLQYIKIDVNNTNSINGKTKCYHSLMKFNQPEGEQCIGNESTFYDWITNEDPDLYIRLLSQSFNILLKPPGPGRQKRKELQNNHISEIKPDAFKGLVLLSDMKRIYWVVVKKKICNYRVKMKCMFVLQGKDRFSAGPRKEQKDKSNFAELDDYAPPLCRASLTAEHMLGEGGYIDLQSPNRDHSRIYHNDEFDLRRNPPSLRGQDGQDGQIVHHGDHHGDISKFAKVHAFIIKMNNVGR